MKAIRYLLFTAVVGCDTGSPVPEPFSGTQTAPVAPVTAIATPEQLARNAFPSVVLLAMVDRNSQPLSLGSGFFVGPGMIATNYHVIQGAAGGSARVIGEREQLPLLGVAAAAPEKDLAVLSVSRQGTPMPLTTDTLPNVGAEVFAIGNPQGLEGTFSAGIVSGVRQVGDGHLIQITAPISPGSSGGPVISRSGDVLGIATATYREGQNLNFAVPARALRELLQGDTDTQPFASLPTRTPGAAWREILGRPQNEAVTASRFMWTGDYDFHHGFVISVRNRLPDPITGILVLVVFYDRSDEPIQTAYVETSTTIAPGLAAMVTGTTNGQIKHMNTPTACYGQCFSRTPSARVDLRVLDFRTLQ